MKETFAQLLSRRMMEEQKTLKDVARVVGVSVAAVHQYKEGFSHPSAVTLKKVCALFRLPYQATMLLIQTEKANGTRQAWRSRNKAQFPEWRSALLDFYDNSILTPECPEILLKSNKEMATEIHQVAVHSIEIKLRWELALIVPKETTVNLADIFTSPTVDKLRRVFSQIQLRWAVPRQFSGLILSVGKKKWSTFFIETWIPQDKELFLASLGVYPDKGEI